MRLLKISENSHVYRLGRDNSKYFKNPRIWTWMRSFKISEKSTFMDLDEVFENI